MKKNKVIIGLISAVVIIGFYILKQYPFCNENKAAKYFDQDKEDILLITEYLASDTNDNIIFRKEGMFAAPSNLNKVNDRSVYQAIYRLLNDRDYHSISKFENTITFTIWTRFNDFGSGLAYSINVMDEPEIQYLTELEPLSEDGWYYYEEDFNEWRIRQQ